MSFPRPPTHGFIILLVCSWLLNYLYDDTSTNIEMWIPKCVVSLPHNFPLSNICTIIASAPLLHINICISTTHPPSVMTSTGWCFARFPISSKQLFRLFVDQCDPHSTVYFAVPWIGPKFTWTNLLATPFTSQSPMGWGTSNLDRTMSYSKEDAFDSYLTLIVITISLACLSPRSLVYVQHKYFNKYANNVAATWCTLGFIVAFHVPV